MRVILIHFHLNTGGVTTVLRQQVDVLQKKGHDLLHLHNPTLAKNRHLQTVLKKLQREGLTLLVNFQINKTVLFSTLRRSSRFSLLKWRAYDG